VLSTVELERIQDACRQVVESGEPFVSQEFEVIGLEYGKKYRLPGNATYWEWRLIPSVDASGKVTALISISRDITAQQCAEAALGRAGQMEALTDVQRAITASLSLDDVLDIIVHSAMNLTGMPAAAVYLLNPDQHSFAPRVSEEVLIELSPPEVFTIEHSLSGRAIRQRKPLSISDTRSAEDLIFPTLDNHKPARSTAVAPIMLNNTVVGTLVVYSPKPHIFADTDLNAMSALAQSAAVAIINARLYGEAIQERNRLQTILDTVPSGIIIGEGLEAKITLTNQRAIELLGRTPPSELPVHEHARQLKLLKPDGTMFEPEELPFSRTILHGETIHGMELLVERPDGSRLTLRASTAPLRDERGNIYAAVGVFDDITPMKRTQEELERERKRLQSIVETVPVGVMVAEGPDVRVTLTNPEAARIYGSTELLGRRTSQRIPMLNPRSPSGRVYGPEDIPLSRALLHGEVVQGEEITIRPSAWCSSNWLTKVFPTFSPCLFNSSNSNLVPKSISCGVIGPAPNRIPYKTIIT
jgi:PAS domain S-box-containing protein